ncbi:MULTISPECIES: hypothetical protein [Methanothrix]|uniref:hypothetical protein n=1 Tax=Methanothrix TaxID=2222 RepID=UPI0023530ABA|nr:hypothetical protein [Methanothrix soehngenii]HUM80774.1 hypothetical protein [Methanothrix sp.]
MDLHARVCVLESDSKRHEEDINQLYGKVSSLEVCASSLPDIKESLKGIQQEIKTLSVFVHSSKGKSIAYLTVREWAILAIAAIGLLLNNIMFK